MKRILTVSEEETIEELLNSIIEGSYISHNATK